MAHVKKPETRKMVNLSPYATALLNDRKARIDKQRGKIGKPDITYTALIELAIENLTIEMGIAK